MSRPLALEVRRLTVRFGPRTVFEDLSFQLEAGTTLAVLGPNGAGKTVLFRALIGAVPSTGSIAWAPGTRIGYVPQKLDLDRDVPITGLDFLQARRALARRRRRQRAADAGAGRPARAVARQPDRALSGGQFQRLLVAFALMGDPTVLMLDEPTAGVDEPGQEQLNALIDRLRTERGLTVLFISHELSVVSQHADAGALPRASARLHRTAPHDSHVRSAPRAVRPGRGLPRA